MMKLVKKQPPTAVSESTILIVDQCDEDLAKYTKHLTRLGYAVIAFTDGDLALEFIQKETSPCDLMIVASQILGHRSCIQLIHAVRKIYIIGILPILVLAEKKNHAHIIPLLTAGANDYLLKPFSRDALSLRIRILLKLKRLLNGLTVQKKQLEDSIEHRNEFIGIAAHDLRSPLATIKYGADMLKEGISSGKNLQTTIAKMIIKQSDHMLNMLNELLNINQIESGKLAVRNRKVEVVGLLSDLIKSHHVHAEKKSIRLHLSTDYKLIFAKLDSDMLGQVLTNFISNAIKYSHAHQKIMVHIRVIDSTLRIEVVDQGIGIPRDEHHLVFQKFAKISTKPTGDESSTGLGLSICHKLAEAMNGTVGFDSEVLKGSTFYIELPGVIVTTGI